MSFLDTRSRRRFSPEKLAKHNLFETPHLFADVYCVGAGQNQKPHRHDGATKVYYVIEGEGVFRVGDEERTLTAGQLAFARPGEIHGVENRSGKELVLLVTMAPNPNVS
jgi:quercetin dioxygenase-like cupin family protein